jgi:protein-S-isoprenylcysteine O-methyltransferase Ste14
MFEDQQMETARPVEESSSTLRRTIFSHRLHVGLAVVALGGLVVRPGNIFGSHQALGVSTSIALVVIGLALRAWAGGCAGAHTRNATIEAPRLVTGGPYAYVRNPIYLASIVLGLGMVGLLGDPWMFALYVGVFIFLYTAIVPAEEAFLRRTFPEEFARYCENVPRILPRLRPWRDAAPVQFASSALLGEARLGLVLVAIYGFMRLAAWLRG